MDIGFNQKMRATIEHVSEGNQCLDKYRNGV
jgi:hypothetical protein